MTNTVVTDEREGDSVFFLVPVSTDGIFSSHSKKTVFYNMSISYQLMRAYPILAILPKAIVFFY